MARTQAASSLQPRVFPVGRAVALLGVAAPELTGRRLTVEGRRVVVARFGRQALLVAYVDSAAFAPAEVARRRTEPAWLRNEARIHERAAARASAHAPVLPAPLLSIFADAAALDDHARENDARWTRAFARLGAKSEYVLHVFYGPHVPPGGEPYLIRVTAQASRSGRAPAVAGPPDVAAKVRGLWETCASFAAGSRRVAVERTRGVLLTSALLVSEQGARALRDAVEAFGVASGPLGLAAYLEGPRLPFSFV